MQVGQYGDGAVLKSGVRQGKIVELDQVASAAGGAQAEVPS